MARRVVLLGLCALLSGAYQILDFESSRESLGDARADEIEELKVCLLCVLTRAREKFEAGASMVDGDRARIVLDGFDIAFRARAQVYIINHVEGSFIFFL